MIGFLSLFFSPMFIYHLCFTLPSDNIFFPVLNRLSSIVDNVLSIHNAPWLNMGVRGDYSKTIHVDNQNAFIYMYSILGISIFSLGHLLRVIWASHDWAESWILDALYHLLFHFGMMFGSFYYSLHEVFGAFLLALIQIFFVDLGGLEYIWF